MASFTTEERRIIDERLQHWVDRLERIIDLIKKDSMSAGDRELTKGLFGDFKDDLEAEKRRLSTTRGEAELTDAERALYLPSILNAHANLTVRRGSNRGPEWFENLSYIRVDLTYYMSKNDP